MSFADQSAVAEFCSEPVGADTLLSHDDDLSIDQVSVCADCAKHPELHQLVISDLAPGGCGVCGSTTKAVFKPSRFREARDLIRALIRLHFDEEQYNPHWGGTSVSAILLDDENPILGRLDDDHLADELIHRIEWNDDDAPDGPGISLYAGHDDDYGRGLQFSIPNTAFGELNEVTRRLAVENFYAVEDTLREIVLDLESEIEASIPADSLWFRTRIGVAEKTLHIGDRKVSRIAVPYKHGEIAALPPPRASAGRMNRQGVSVLYVASDIKTALAEIRPHPAHLLSIGGFRAVKQLRVANFDLPIAPFSSSNERLAKFARIYHIDTLLSSPIVPEERHQYAATQLLADALVRRGFDGVTYRSSVGFGKNLCAFNPADFTYEESSAAVCQIDRLAYDYSEVAMTIEATRHKLPQGETP